MFSRSVAFIASLLVVASALAAEDAKVVDLPTRAGVTQRFLLTVPPDPKAAAILFAGGDGGLRISESGAIRSLRNNFLVRAAPLFAARGVAVAIVDAPSDKQDGAFLSYFRESAEHATDVKTVIAWLREQLKVPVWLIGTSLGTQSVAAVSTRLGGDGADGIVLTSTILAHRRTTNVPDMDLQKIRVPVLVVHHEQDGCFACPFRDVPRLMNKLSAASKKELVSFRGGENQGDPCAALAYHGYNGLDPDVTARIADWITAR
jgi:hypothetical protein